MSLVRSESRTPAASPADASGVAAHPTPTRPSSPAPASDVARKRTSSPPRMRSDQAHNADRKDDNTEPPARRPTLTAPVPSSPQKAPAAVGGLQARRASVGSEHAARAAAQKKEDIRATQSEPALSAHRPAPTPTEYQEYFYQIGSPIVPLSLQADQRALLAVAERKEGLKIYVYEPAPGQLYAISHAPSESTQAEGKSTQHQELQKALLFAGVAKSQGRFATEDEAQRKENKKIARAFTDKKPHPAHGGLRLQKHEGQYVIDVSSAFSFHGVSDASMECIARFYANVLKQAETPVSRVSVIPADASCSPRMCIEAAPHLQQLAKRIEANLDE